MTRQELFDLVHVNTERKWEKLNLLPVFIDVVQDFCGQNRFWWRQILAQLNTIPGQGTYDLTATGVITNVDMGELKVEEIVTVQGVNLHPNCSRTELPPIFDSAGQLDMILNAVNAVPSRYFLGYNDDHTLVIDPPDSAYSLWIDMWAMPDIKNDSTSSAIPLIPNQFHRVIRSGMEAYVWEHVYGASNPKYVIAKNKYDEGILDAQARPRFSTNYAQTLVSSESAIRST